MDLELLNQTYKTKTSEEIINWVLQQQLPTISSTSFGPNSAVLLHLISGTGVPVIWVDSGYNLRDTYVVAEKIMEQLDLNMHIEVPTITAERMNAVYGAPPTLAEAERHQQFTNIVKLDPFRKAIAKFNPKIWISGLRKTDNEHRSNLDIFSIDKNGILKVAPFFYWDDQQVSDYMQQHNLPSCRHYFDPTKLDSGRECGLHTNL